MKIANFKFSLLCLVLFIWSCEQLQNPGEIQLDTDSASQKVFILSIDGGGIKGVIPAYFLQQIEDSLQTPIYQLFDLIGGTSTGGLLSIALTSSNPSDTTGLPYSATQLTNIYLNDCAQIFVENDKGDVEYGPSYYARYSSTSGIEPYLQSMVGDTTTLKTARAGLPNPKVQQVFTTTYVVNSNGSVVDTPMIGRDYGPYLFNWKSAAKSPEDNYYRWEAARGTSAAPGYFPIASVGSGKSGRSPAAQKWTIDGGVMSNNPTVWAISQAFEHNLVSSLDDIIVISLGCGSDPFNGGVGVTNELKTPSWVTGQEFGFWSDADWLEDLYNLKGDKSKVGRIASLLLEGNQLVTNLQIESMKKAGLTYYRLQPTLPGSLVEMDKCSNAPLLKQTAVSYTNTSGDGYKTMQEIIESFRANLIRER